MGELSATRLRGLLEDQEIGRDIQVFREVVSTNEMLSQIAAEGARHGTAVVADAQIAGRGRLGRSWSSPPGTNIYTSVLLRGFDAATAPLAVYLAGVAVAEAMERLADIAPFVKWPNDVHARGKKLAGILCESVPGAADHGVIIGIGWNVNALLNDFPREIRDTATSLHLLTGRRFDRALVLAELYRHLERRYNEFRADRRIVLERWKTLARIGDVRYRVGVDGRVVDGTATDLAPDGALVLTCPGGERAVIHSGDVLAYE
ncbi:MAG: biotin--[acetyl-CoA-carboxylase] ligase [Deltaproteobacteria bacterium]|nr:biotin--[acetyl-CoA-carboxylase] ligase [Deltaproteobacteria bacterium]